MSTDMHFSDGCQEVGLCNIFMNKFANGNLTGVVFLFNVATFCDVTVFVI